MPGVTPLRGVGLVQWIALRRVCGGGVTYSGGRWLDLGRLVPCYLPEVFDDLLHTGLIALAELDEWCLRRAAPTVEGRSRYLALSAPRSY